jgi:hypothetical protein
VGHSTGCALLGRKFLRRKFIAINASIKNTVKSQINNIMLPSNS